MITWQLPISTLDGGYLIAGYSLSGISGDKRQMNWGGKDYWIVKITSGAGVVNTLTPELKSEASKIEPTELHREQGKSGVNLKVQSNPFTEKVILSFKLEKAQPISLQVFDINGNLVASWYQPEAAINKEHEFELKSGTLKPGMYLAYLKTANGVNKQKLLLTR